MKKLYYLVPIVLFCSVFCCLFADLYHEAKFAFSTGGDSANTCFTLIIDPGHGGSDGGAVSENGTVESIINLDICAKMRDIAGLFSIPTVMTRDSEKIVYPDTADTISKMKKYDQNSRKELISSTENGILISIHQNQFQSSKPYGAQVLYADNEDSKAMGELFQSALVLNLQNENYRTSAKISDSIYLFKKLKIPAILIECGFLSNEKEEQLLNTDSYRLKLAAIVISSYQQYISERK